MSKLDLAHNIYRLLLDSKLGEEPLRDSEHVLEKKKSLSTVSAEVELILQTIDGPHKQLALVGRGLWALQFGEDSSYTMQTGLGVPGSNAVICDSSRTKS